MSSPGPHNRQEWGWVAVGVCILQSQRRKFRLPRAYETLHGLYFSPPDSESLTGAEASVFFKCPRWLWTRRWRTSALTDLETSHCHTSTCACKFLFLQSKLKPLFSYVISLICQACSCLRAFAYLSNISSSAFLFSSSGLSSSYLIREILWPIHL